MKNTLSVVLGSALLIVTSSCSSTPPPEALVERSLATEAVQNIDTDLGEQLQPNEADSITELARVIPSFTMRRYQEGKRPATRDAHAKGHACVKARFHVNEALAKEYQHGVFSPGKEYNAWIRFSNGDGEINPDKAADARGMAIKLLGVEGKKLLPEEASAKTQDFIMINHPVFFMNDIARYVALVTEFDRRILTDKSNPINKISALTHLKLREIKIANDISSSKIGNSLETQYWSMVPYRLGSGSDRMATKFTAKPCSPGTSKVPGRFSRVSDNYLKERINKTLATRDACFIFYIQRFVDENSTPVEDSTVEWKTSVSPLIEVARITIPKFSDPAHTADNPKQQEFCENMSFTPWHALADHKPLGAVNRARKVVYRANSITRHKLNQAPRVEPTGDEKF